VFVGSSASLAHCQEKHTIPCQAGFRFQHTNLQANAAIDDSSAFDSRDTTKTFEKLAWNLDRWNPSPLDEHASQDQTATNGNAMCGLLAVLGTEFSNVRLDGGLGQRRGFQDALRVQGLPDLEHGPRRPDGVPGGVQPFVGCSGSFVPVPAQHSLRLLDVRSMLD